MKKITYNGYLLYNEKDYNSVEEKIKALYQLMDEAIKSKNLTVHSQALKEYKRLKGGK